MTDLRTGGHLLAEPHAGVLCTGRFSLTNTSRDRCARTRTSFPGCRRRAAAWKVCLGGADRHPCRNNKSCRTGCRPVRSGIAFRGTTERIACVFDNTSRPRACEGTWRCSGSGCAVLGPRYGPVSAPSARQDAALPARPRPRGRCAPGAVRARSLAPAIPCTLLLRSEEIRERHELRSTPFYRGVRKGSASISPSAWGGASSGSESPSTRSVATWRRPWRHKPDSRTGRQPVRRTTKCSWRGVRRSAVRRTIESSGIVARLKSNMVQTNRITPGRA